MKRPNKLRLTGFLELLVGQPPGVSDAQQVVFQSVQVRVRTVALREVCAALTPAFAVSTHKLALGFTADVVEGSLNETALQVAGEDDLQPWGAANTGRRWDGSG